MSVNLRLASNVYFKMFIEIGKEEREDFPKIVKIATRLLDIDMSSDHKYGPHEVLDSVLRAIEDLKKRNYAEPPAEVLNVLGLFYGDLIINNCGWHWAFHCPTPESMEVCVTDRAEGYFVLPLRDVWSVFEGLKPTLVLQYRMIEAGKLPPLQASPILLSV